MKFALLGHFTRIGPSVQPWEYKLIVGPRFISDNLFLLWWCNVLIFQIDPNVSTLFLGLTASSYSISHFLFAFLFGFWVEKRNAKEPLLFSVSTIIVGSIIYAYAETVSGSAGSYMVFVSRSVVGLVAGKAFYVLALSISLSSTYPCRSFSNSSKLVRKATKLDFVHFCSIIIFGSIVLLSYLVLLFYYHCQFYWSIIIFRYIVPCSFSVLFVPYHF